MDLSYMLHEICNDPVTFGRHDLKRNTASMTGRLRPVDSHHKGPVMFWCFLSCLTKWTFEDTVKFVIAGGRTIDFGGEHRW